MHRHDTPPSASGKPDETRPAWTMTVAEHRAILRQELAALLERRQAAEPAAPRRQAETVQATAAELGVHVATVRRMLRDGRLRGRRTGTGGSSRVLVSRQSIDELVGVRR